MFALLHDFCSARQCSNKFGIALAFRKNSMGQAPYPNKKNKKSNLKNQNSNPIL